MSHSNNIRLATTPPAEPMVDGGRHQQHGPGGGAEQAGEKADTLRSADPAEAGRERNGKQEGKEHLRTGQNNPEFR